MRVSLLVLCVAVLDHFNIQPFFLAGILFAMGFVIATCQDVKELFRK